MPRARHNDVRQDIETIRGALASVVNVLGRIGKRLDASARGPKLERQGRKLRLSAARRKALKLQGLYMGHMRGLEPRQKKRVKALKATRGFRAAIALAKKLAKR